MIEIIANTLYFIPGVDQSFRETAQFLYLCTDDSLVYTAFFADFGPLDLGSTYTFCEKLDKLLLEARKAKKPVVYYCSSHPHRRSNAAVLICAYQIFRLRRTAAEVYAPFIGIEPPFIPFRDAVFNINSFPSTVLDCVRAMDRACQPNLKHFVYENFSLEQFQTLKKLQHGDISWIIPNKFIAFSGPVTKRREIEPGVFSLLPKDYIPIFKQLGVTCVVRFNSKCYDRLVFTSAGIRHVDLYYEDGANPTEGILQSFLQVCETEKGVIAVHCKAGLGRTGTNIAAYMIKHYGYTARESIAWCRLCRPGSIVGPQQQYLLSIEEKLRVEGEAFKQQQAEQQLRMQMQQALSNSGSPQDSRTIRSGFPPHHRMTSSSNLTHSPTSSSAGPSSPSLLPIRGVNHNSILTHATSIKSISITAASTDGSSISEATTHASSSTITPSSMSTLSVFNSSSTADDSLRIPPIQSPPPVLSPVKSPSTFGLLRHLSRSNTTTFEKDKEKEVSAASMSPLRQPSVKSLSSPPSLSISVQQQHHMEETLQAASNRLSRPSSRGSRLVSPVKPTSSTFLEPIPPSSAPRTPSYRRHDSGSSK